MLFPRMKVLIALGGLLSIAHGSRCKPSSTITSSTALPSSVTSEASTVSPTSTLSAVSGTTSTTSASLTSTTNLSEPTPCVIDPECPASGFSVDYYSNVFMDGYGNDDMTVPPSYYITQNLEPLDSSVTNTAYFPQDYMQDLAGYSTIFPAKNHAGEAWYVGYHRTLAGGIKVDGNNFTLVYTGYYRAPVTGTYTLCVTADNANTLFFGEGNAFKCSTGEPSANAPALTVTATGYNFNNPTQCGTVSLTKDYYYPVRNVMGNKNAVSMFEFTIQPPEGTATHDFSGLLHPVQCGLQS